MTELKCPVCDSYLHKIPVKEAWVCSIHDSKDDLYGSKALWQALIYTKEKLDLAIWGLEWIFGYENVPKYVLQHIRKVLDEIKDNDKDVK